MILESEVKEHLSRYLEDQLSLDDFEDWLVQKSWNMHQDSDRRAREMVSQVELLLSEYADGHFSEPMLKSELGHIINPMMAIPTISSTSVIITGSPFTYRPIDLIRVDRKPELVFSSQGPLQDRC